MRIAPEELEELKAAKRILENPGITAKLTNLVGRPLEKGLKLLPGDWQEKVGVATRDALMTALKGALLTMGPGTTEASPRWHKFAAAMSGGIGGAFGLPALIVELPVSTTIMLRSIADIGRSQGEVLSTVQAQIACLEVFALGGPTGQGGGGINLLFIDHLQDMSRGHFVVRKLERKYDQLLVRDMYERL
jgi:EcsC protein family